MKAFLTSAGFDNENLISHFNTLKVKTESNSRALFIPTALNTSKSRKYIHVFMGDLYKIGYDDSNIDIYDLDEPFEEIEIVKYDVVFFCAGDPEYLLQKINEMNFNKTLNSFLDNGGTYIGVSAGSDIVARNLPNNLGYLNVIIECHSKQASPIGALDTNATQVVKITDNNAIIIDGDKITLV